jgi:DNA recombination protein RmuC
MHIELLSYGEGKTNMLAAIIVLQILLLLGILALLLRKTPSATPDPRHLQLPDQVASVLTRHDALDNALRSGISELRREHGLEAAINRESNAKAFTELRTEVTSSIHALGQQLHADIHAQHESIAQRLANSATESREHQDASRETLHRRLTELAAANTDHQEKLRTTVGESLSRLNADNTAKLEEMRATVDEKLHATLHTRLTESFGQVTDQLNKVHTGLGEMSKLSEGVDGLSRIFTNVKSRGGFAEVQLGMLLKQMLAPGQFLQNATVKPGTLERVEYAIRFPGHSGERLMPIDAKFPREAWERLETAYESNLPEAIAKAGTAFESAIRTEAERICAKYINQPVTTPYAVMFLPTESLYAEVVRRDALQAEIQSKCHVTIAGPTTLSAILTSFQMGFHMLALQEKGDEVWKVLEKTKTEFRTFETLMDSMGRQVGTVQSTIEKLGVRTRAINKSLRDVSDTETPQLTLEEALPQTLALAAEAED